MTVGLPTVNPYKSTILFCPAPGAWIALKSTGGRPAKPRNVSTHAGPYPAKWLLKNTYARSTLSPTARRCVSHFFISGVRSIWTHPSFFRERSPMNRRYRKSVVTTGGGSVYITSDHAIATSSFRSSSYTVSLNQEPCRNSTAYRKSFGRDFRNSNSSSSPRIIVYEGASWTRSTFAFGRSSPIARRNRSRGSFAWRNSRSWVTSFGNFAVNENPSGTSLFHSRVISGVGIR